MKFNNLLLHKHILQKQTEIMLANDEAISLRRICQTIGVENYTLSRILNSDKVPSLVPLLKICKWLDTDIDDYIILDEE
jgi:transcriptional regulator with XRE-family HTH domain